MLFMGFARQEYWSGLPFPFPVDHALSEFSTMIRPSWMALHGMAHSFIEFTRVWSMWSVWLVFCDCGFHSVCPLMDKDKRVMEASWWERVTERGTGSCSDGQNCIPSLLFELRPNYGEGNEDNEETMETVRGFIILGSKITADSDYSHENKRCLLLRRKAMINLDSILKSRDISNKGLSSQNYGFSSSHVWMWELDYKESWALKNWCFWTVVLEKTLKSHLDSREIKSVHPKGN